MPKTKKSVDYNSDTSEESFEQVVSLPSFVDPLFLLYHPQTSPSSLPPQSPLTGIFETEHTNQNNNNNNNSSLNRDNFNPKQQHQQLQGIIIASQSISTTSPVDTTTSLAMKTPIVLHTGSLSITPVNIPSSPSTVTSTLDQEQSRINNNITPPALVVTSVYNNNNNNNNNSESSRDNIWSNQQERQQQLLSTMTGHHQYEHQSDQQQLSSMNSSDDRNSPPNSPVEPQSKKAFIVENINEDSEMSEPGPDSTACDRPNSNNSTNFPINSTGQTNAVQYSTGTVGSVGEDNVDMACSFMQRNPSLPPLPYSRQAYSFQSHSPHMQIPQQNYFGYSAQQQQQSVNTNANTTNNNNHQSQFGSISNINSSWQQQQQLQHEHSRGRSYHSFHNMEDVEREKISTQQQQQYQQQNHHPTPSSSISSSSHAFQNSHSHNVMPYPMSHHPYHHHHHHNRHHVQSISHSHMHQRQTNFNQQQQQGAALNSNENTDVKPLILSPELPSTYSDSYPGGLEHVFKGIPVECQKLITPDDVPDTARFRGYFTVCELIQLKRQLLQRYQHGPSGYTYKAQSTAEQARQAALRADNVKNFNNTLPNNSNNNNNNKNSSSSSNSNTIENISTEVEGTAHQVKGALDILNDEDDQLLHEEILQQQQQRQKQPVSSSQEQQRRGNQQQQSESWTNRDIQNNSSCSSSTTDIHSHGSPYSPVLTIDERPQQHLYNQQQPIPHHASLQQQQSRRLLPHLTPMPLDREGREHISVTPDIKYLGSVSTTPSPPVSSNHLSPTYRTSTLVFKLLQIGNYSFRSFSDEPNKLKVQFNAQKLSYECQLPHEYHPSQDLPRGQKKPLRKILSIEIAFDQITSMRFYKETGKMELRVDGNPLLNCQYLPLGESGSLNQQPPLSLEDQTLLEHISKQQLQLGVHHHVHFLNERLVQQLEGQFRDHPRFRHLISEPEHTRLGQ